MKHIYDSLGDHLLGQIRKTVHGVLIGHESLGCLVDVSILDLEGELIHKISPDKLPLEVSCETVELLLYVLCGDFAVVGYKQPPLQESLGELQGGLLHEVVTNVFVESPLSLVLVLGLEPLTHFLVYILVALLFLLFLIVFLHTLGH